MGADIFPDQYRAWSGQYPETSESDPFTDKEGATFSTEAYRSWYGEKGVSDLIKERDKSKGEDPLFVLGPSGERYWLIEDKGKGVRYALNEKECLRVLENEIYPSRQPLPGERDRLEELRRVEPRFKYGDEVHFGDEPALVLQENLVWYYLGEGTCMHYVYVRGKTCLLFPGHLKSNP